MAKIVTRLLDIGFNLQLIFVITAAYPNLLQDTLMLITILNVFACLCIHYIMVYGLVVIDSTVLVAVYRYLIEYQSEPMTKLFFIGVIVHLMILNNKLMTNII
ncbi:MAG: hypothetical protein NDP13_02680 [Crenarchaeota archaeon]|nr:hypothetical protein [Thermoproteota archaeon]MCR8453872.1 hypothetical protein [Thermoproteota archaeon]MCR8455309.1 hypothetical protein [Thermoproteota archaeon]MCR8462579.1 hypothetical protein [Thermoproteota archaeon]MCR8470693.1 hypothetical protein [Thermoproteota archaeon]